MNLARELASLLGYNLERRSRQLTLQAHLASVIEARGIDCIIDVGANRGSYGRMLRSIGYRGTIVSLEPLSGPFRELSAHASRDRGWRVHQVALSDSNGAARILGHARSDLSSLLRMNELGRQIFGDQDPARAEEIRLQRADALWPSAIEAEGSAYLLKSDTQGHDLAVLSGFGSMLERVSAIQIEAAFRLLYEGMPRFDETMRFIEARGFELSGFYPVSRDKALRIVEADLVFVRS